MVNGFDIGRKKVCASLYILPIHTKIPHVVSPVFPRLHYIDSEEKNMSVNIQWTTIKSFHLKNGFLI